MSEEFDCIVVGAGLAGLTAARYLQSAGLSTLVIESSSRPGGRVKSDQLDGFTLDHGFQVINSGYPNIKMLGLLEDLEFTPIAQGGLPFRIVGGIHKPSDLTRPFLRGVFLTEPRNVSPRVRAEIYKSFLFGKPGLVSGGASAFSELLAAPVSNIHFNETVQNIDGTHVKTDHALYSARVVVVATDPTTATHLVPSLDVIRTSSSTTWYHVADSIIEGAGRLAVPTSGSLIHSIAISDVNTSYAPKGSQLFSSTTLKNISESEVRKELSNIWRCKTSDWQFIAKYEINQSLPIHPAGKPLYSPREIRSDLFVVGDHRGYPSQQGAMETGKRAAKKIIERALQAR